MPNPRKPRALKAIEGTLRPSRDYPEPEYPAPASIDPPDWITGPDAVQEWKRIVGLLLPTRVLTDADLSALGHLCNLHAACVRKYRAGMDPNAADLTQLRLLYGEFTLTPASRSKAAPAKAGDKGNAFTKLRTG